VIIAWAAISVYALIGSACVTSYYVLHTQVCKKTAIKCVMLYAVWTYELVSQLSAETLTSWEG